MIIPERCAWRNIFVSFTFVIFPEFWISEIPETPDALGQRNSGRAGLDKTDDHGKALGLSGCLRNDKDFL